MSQKKSALYDYILFQLSEIYQHLRKLTHMCVNVADAHYNELINMRNRTKKLLPSIKR